MGTKYRTFFKHSILLGIPVGLVGISFGALAVAGGVSPLMACAMSLLVFAGGSQFAALAVVTGGGSLVAAVVSGLVLNSRYLAFGMTLAPHLDAARREPERGASPRYRRAAEAHLLVDESFALALTERDPGQARAAYLCCGAVIFVLWNAGTAVGAAAGSVLGDPRVLGLDAALPAAMAVLLAPLLQSRRALVAAALGGALALGTAPFTPAGVPVLCAALGAILALLMPERPRRNQEE